MIDTPKSYVLYFPGDATYKGSKLPSIFNLLSAITLQLCTYRLDLIINTEYQFFYPIIMYNVFLCAI